MSEWREVNVGDIANLYQGLAINKKTDYLLVDKSTLPLLRIKDLQENTQEFFVNDKEAPEKCIANEEDLIFTRTGIVGMVFMGKKGVVHNNCFRIVPKSNEVYLPFYYHYFNRENMRDYLTNISAGSVQPDMNHTIFKTVKVPFPPLEEQKAIAEVLSSLDDKIDLLHRQNKTLEELAQTLFRQWFIEEADEGWEEKPLSKIANFLNGLACQKIPPLNDVDKLPVLKIKDLKAGISDSSDWATSDVKPEYIIESGDVIFAWSASLMVKIWDGQKCVLNQHLFKVTSDNYPKWFYYQWCKYHLDRFIAIAQAHATTMGHIKRKDLDNAMCFIPSEDKLEVMSEQMNPLIEKMETNSKQIKTLENMRDTLLPKLMSGEVKIKINGEKNDQRFNNLRCK